MADIKDWRSLSDPNPEWQKLLESMGGQAPDIGMFPDIASLRHWIIEAKKNLTATFEPVPGVKEEKDHQITVRDGSKITVRTYEPEKTGGPLAVVYHGGGFCIGGLDNEELLCRNMCGKFGCAVVNVDYRLAPEFKFPIAHTDCYDATKWAAQNASRFGGDPSKGFLIGGTSAGGNITATISHLARDDKLSPPITGCHLMIPAICTSSAIPEKYKKDYHSWEQNRTAAILSVKACDLFFNNYMNEPEKEGSGQMFSPMLWESGHKGLPPAYFQICGSDPLRDEALIYERILREDEGIKTKVDVYGGLPHGYWSIFPQLEASKKFVADSIKGVQWLLEQKS